MSRTWYPRRGSSKCPVLPWGGDVAAGIQEGFLEVAAMGLLPESDLAGWKRKVFQAEGTA